MMTIKAGLSAAWASLKAAAIPAIVVGLKAAAICLLTALLERLQQA